MFSTDLTSVFQWWFTIFVLGLIFVPFASLLFSGFFDKGYIFSKIIGIIAASYFIFILGFLKLLPFNQLSIIITLFLFAFINYFILKRYPTILLGLKKTLKLFLFEEIIFISILFTWAFIHAHQPEIHGLEKYMDFGFINSILRTEYFPPKDMWFTPLPINYYYFGHLVTAVLTKLSNLPSSITYNLMLSLIPALSFTAVFSVVANLLYFNLKRGGLRIAIIGGLISGYLVNFAGNLHAIYLFFKPYVNENPVPFWNLAFSPLSVPNSYWYPNATRFIYNTIHEFPIYSNVVSDLHGHFLDMPFALLTVAVILSFFMKKAINRKSEILTIGFLLAVLYMTNAWDGIIYFILASLIIGYVDLKSITNPSIQNSKIKIKKYDLKFKILIKLLMPKILLLGFVFFVFSFPFNLNFKPFASGIGILCAPDFLINIKQLGPFLFEADHCQHSPLWQLLILYGFFYFWAISFLLFVYKIYKLNKLKFSKNSKSKIENLFLSDFFILILIILSTFLIILPELIYVKDIYPAHYRANTMFKLTYQSFILLSISCAYIIVRLRPVGGYLFRNNLTKLTYWVIGYFLIFLVSIYPYFAVNSYFGDLKNYMGLNGLTYLKNIYPNDYEAILWINKNIKNQPVILEAQGDSYTDYARVSTNTGLPTILGWTVHEWLWRGTYDIPAPRIDEVTRAYESEGLEETKKILNKYNVSLIFIGKLEKQKYKNLNEEKFYSLGKVIFQKRDTKIFQINPN